MGFVTQRIVRDLSARKKIGQKMLMDFKIACKKYMRTTVNKLIEKSPLNYSLVLHFSFLDPREMAGTNGKTLYAAKLKKALTYLVNSHWVKEENCDDII